MRDKRQKIVNQVDTKPATQIEKNYAKSLGVDLPEAATKSDAQALIARELDNDDAASEGLLSYAREKGMLCSDYIGRKALHNQMFDNLSPLDQIIFFCFCVHKFYTEDSNENLMAHPKKALFEAFGAQYEQDGYFKASLEEYLGEELVAFGKSTRVINGVTKTIYGGSAHTRAHNVAYAYLQELR